MPRRVALAGRARGFAKQIWLSLGLTLESRQADRLAFVRQPQRAADE